MLNAKKKIQQGLLRADVLISHNAEMEGGTKSSDNDTNMRLLASFNEKDPDTFVLLLERIADARNWPDVDHTLTLQSGLTGKIQEAFATLKPADSMSYQKHTGSVFVPGDSRKDNLM